MVSSKLESMKRQRGTALIMVLLVLALGSLLITPMLNYVSTGLTGVRVTEEFLLRQYAADAAVEYSLWQLNYNVDGLTEGLDLENPSDNTTITVNGIEVPIITEISMSPDSDNGTFTVLGTESGIHVAAALTILPPAWCGTGQKEYVTHLVYIYNYGTAATHLKAAFQQLDPDLMYVEGSYEGPSATLTKTNAGDHWELYFDFTEPLPKLNSEDIILISFITWTRKNMTMGEHTFSGSGHVTYAAFQEEEVASYSGESGLGAVGLYDITVSIGGYTVLVNVGITEEGELVMRSWQIQ